MSGQSFVVEGATAVALAPSRTVAATSTLPEHCIVSGFAAPQVGFEIRLPTSNWNGRFLQQGCRGLCGFIPTDTTNDALARGYAVATTDMGHKAANSQSAIWAVDNPHGKIDFGHRATHVTAVTAQTLIEKFYGAKPKARYFRGCGTGGRQALVEAQRYPDDFDGIIANGGIVFDFTKLNYLMAWSVRANVNARGEQILAMSDVELLHAATMKACDRNDGLADGVISEPQRCEFDPRQLVCRPGQAAGCLTPEKVGAAQKMYAGPTTDLGTLIYPGMAKGSELRWLSAFFGATPNYEKFSTEIMRYFLFDVPKGPSFRLAEFDLNTPLATFAATESLVSADSTNYNGFRQRGGKVLAIHGWNESAMPGAYAQQYYDRLVKDHGDLKTAREFFRLYMIPGDMHCTSGIPEGRHFDSLTVIEQWVESDIAPDVITGYEITTEPKLPDQVQFPINPQSVKSVRPFAPYPDSLTYRGRGDPAAPKNYKRHAP
jgi:feruloyl esterase